MAQSDSFESSYYTQNGVNGSSVRTKGLLWLCISFIKKRTISLRDFSFVKAFAFLSLENTLQPLLMDWVHLSQGYITTTKGQFTFYHSIPRSSVIHFFNFWIKLTLERFSGFNRTLSSFVCQYLDSLLQQIVSVTSQWHVQNPIKQPKMEFIGWKPLTIFEKSFILDVWQGSEYVSDRFILLLTFLLW